MFTSFRIQSVEGCLRYGERWHRCYKQNTNVTLILIIWRSERFLLYLYRALYKNEDKSEITFVPRCIHLNQQSLTKPLRNILIRIGFSNIQPKYKRLPRGDCFTPVLYADIIQQLITSSLVNWHHSNCLLACSQLRVHVKTFC